MEKERRVDLEDKKKDEGEGKKKNRNKKKKKKEKCQENFYSKDLMHLSPKNVNYRNKGFNSSIFPVSKWKKEQNSLIIETPSSIHNSPYRK